MASISTRTRAKTTGDNEPVSAQVSTSRAAISSKGNIEGEARSKSKRSKAAKSARTATKKKKKSSGEVAEAEPEGTGNIVKEQDHAVDGAGEIPVTLTTATPLTSHRAEMVDTHNHANNLNVEDTAEVPSSNEKLTESQNVASKSVNFDNINEKELAKSVFSIYKSVSYNTSIPKGIPKSGRKWKTEKTERFSEMKKDKPLRTSWEKKMKEKAEKKSIKMYERQLQESRASEIQKKKDRKADKLKRKLENERKSEVVQVLKNTAKLKRMKKKQLRQIEKR
ncbi:LOW QUALITY PROTEIN: uncharacterized protein [Amphiura filiformis]|uniref:LOW QUALITY PROTEIN: uncharacterized protein n=1 Tax=Amphiura filiformis TaxID=82378 RepID=UPI003B216038